MYRSENIARTVFPQDSEREGFYMDKSKLGLIHIYTGNGKGKTTAALGLILRASGRGLNVVLGQFLKGRETGELRTLSLLPGVKVFRGKPLTKFSFQMNEKEKAEVLQSHNEFIQELASCCRKEGTEAINPRVSLKATPQVLAPRSKPIILFITEVFPYHFL